MIPSSSKPSEGEAELPGKIVLDACVLLNLYATGRVEEVLESVSSQLIVSPYVRGEALWYLIPGDSGRVDSQRCDVSLEPLIVTGLIEVADLTPPEQNTFVEFAVQLGDGEAASGALAIGRSAAVATDDRKARQLFVRRKPPIQVVGTATLLRSWEVRAGVDRIEVAAALHAIRSGARFEPRDGDGDTDWWHERIREESSRTSA